jgi:hypothetical protein
MIAKNPSFALRNVPSSTKAKLKMAELQLDFPEVERPTKGATTKMALANNSY